MVEPRMTRDELDHGLDMQGPEGQAYYERAIKEAESILESDRKSRTRVSNLKFKIDSLWDRFVSLAERVHLSTLEHTHTSINEGSIMDDKEFVAKITVEVEVYREITQGNPLSGELPGEYLVVRQADWTIATPGPQVSSAGLLDLMEWEDLDPDDLVISEISDGLSALVASEEEGE